MHCAENHNGFSPLIVVVEHLQVSVSEMEAFLQRLSRREREVVQRFYSTHCSPDLARALGW
jgi:FixJ family two-component response regulator